MTPARRWWRAPLWTALAVLLTAGPLGYGGRDFGVFLLVLLIYLPCLALACLLLLLWAIFARRSSGRKAALASLTVVILLTPGTAILFGRLHDRIAFAFWAPTHGALLGSWQGRSGIVMLWDSWGIADAGQDSVLISAPSDMLTDVRTLAATACAEPDCVVGDIQKMKGGFYIASFYYP